MRTGSTLLTIKAEAVFNNGDGTFGLVIEGVELTDEQRAVIHDLLPNFSDDFYKALSKELLVASLVKEPVKAPENPTEVQPEPSNDWPRKGKPKSRSNDPPEDKLPY